MVEGSRDVEDGQGGGAELVDVGSLASLTQTLTDAESFEDLVRRVTGRQDYKFGDLSKDALRQLTGKVMRWIERWRRELEAERSGWP